MALKRYVEPAWLRSSVARELESGEEVVVMADFFLPVPNQYVGRLFVLTSRRLHCIAFKQTLGSMFGQNTKPRPVTWSYALGFHQIHSFGEMRQEGLLVKEMKGMAFTGATGTEVWWTPYAEGVQLIEQLRDRVNLPPVPVGMAQELEKLAVLQSEGVITADEFSRAKEHFIGRPPDKQDQALQMLRQLHSLHAAGVLSASEFNMKSRTSWRGPDTFGCASSASARRRPTTPIALMEGRGSQAAVEHRPSDL